MRAWTRVQEANVEVDKGAKVEVGKGGDLGRNWDWHPI
jgi:hypothetical protein